jgi:hypothetical protein
MQKRGQLTVFMIMGIAILLVVLILIYIYGGLAKVDAKPKVSGLKDIEDFANYCLAQNAREGLVLLGKQGGYLPLINPFFTQLNTSYLYYSGRNYVPDISAVEGRLARYVETKIKECLDSGKSEFEKKAIRITQVSEPAASVIIAEKDVVFMLNWSLKAEQRTETFAVDNFADTEKLRLKEILSAAGKLVQSEIDNNGLFDLDAITEELNIMFFPYGPQSTLVTVIQDHDYLVGTLPYRFVFAHAR